MICELGCNDGRVLVPFYKHGYPVLGIDTQTEAIREAQISIPNGTFGVQDARIFTAPSGSFVIIRNVLPFLGTKEEVHKLLERHSDHQMFFTFFGPEDESANGQLSWTRGEAEHICKEFGAKVIGEFNGTNKNMAGCPRRTHVFYCLKP